MLLYLVNQLNLELVDFIHKYLCVQVKEHIVMAYTLTQEEQEVLSEIKSDLIILQQGIVRWLIELMRYCWNTSKLFLFSLEEFSLKNIRTYGVGEILYQRALRFFGLKEKKQVSRSKQSHKNDGRFERSKPRRSVLKSLIVLVLGKNNTRINRNSRKKIGKNVYIEKIE